MMATIWSAQAYFVIPVGAVCLLLLLSDMRRLQKVAIAVCSIHISFGVLRMSLSSIFAVLSTIIFVVQAVTTYQTAHHLPPTPSMTVEMVDRLRMKEWRNDRNWWIALFGCTIWFIVWRLQIWTLRYCLAAPAVEATTPKQPASNPVNKKKD